MTKTAILVDGGFYRRRAYSLMGGLKTPKERADELEDYCKKHLKYNGEHTELYRVFYYDCPPISKRVYHPILNKQIDFSKSDDCKWMLDYFQELRHKRKFALRLGVLAEEQAMFRLKQQSTKDIINKKKTLDELSEADFELTLTQKGVDMRIGVDIASLAFKKLVDRIILISGDSDFVPAAKLARREGIDFILDPMRNGVRNDLFEHIDGMRTVSPPKPLENKSEKLISTSHTQNVFTNL